MACARVGLSIAKEVSMESVLITGVSTGIGYDTALKVADRGFHVFGSVRRADDARSLVEKLGSRFTPLLFDVTDAAALDAAADTVKAAIGSANLAALVNNAGFTVNGPLAHMPIEEIEKQFAVNVFGVLRVTQAFLPLLGMDREGEKKPGRIINISSTMGRITAPFLGAYAASKHALEALSDAFRRELFIYGIKVIVIEPGVINTPIWNKKKEVSPYADTDYGPYHERFLEWAGNPDRPGLSVGKVSEVICTALVAEEPKTRYALLQGGLKGKIKKWWLPRILSDRWLDRVLQRTWGK